MFENMIEELVQIFHSVEETIIDYVLNTGNLKIILMEAAGFLISLAGVSYLSYVIKSSEKKQECIGAEMVLPVDENFQKSLEKITNTLDNLDEAQEEQINLIKIHHTATMSTKAGNAEQCILLLMKYSSAVNNPREPYGYTPFLSACWSGSLPLVRFMVEHGADVGRTTNDGDSGLYLAVRALLESTSPLNTSLLQVLLSAGCSVNVQNHLGYTPLHLACSTGSKRLVQWLLRHNASPLIRTKQGMRPIDLAILAGHTKVEKLLKTASRDHFTVKRSRTPTLSSSSSSTSSSIWSFRRNFNLAGGSSTTSSLAEEDSDRDI